MWRDFLDGPVHKAFWIGVGTVPGAIVTVLVLRLVGIFW